MTPEQRRTIEVDAVIRMVRLNCYAREGEIEDPVLREVLERGQEQEAGTASPERERRYLGQVMDRLGKGEG